MHPYLQTSFKKIVGNFVPIIPRRVFTKILMNFSRIILQKPLTIIFGWGWPINKNLALKLVFGFIIMHPYLQTTLIINVRNFIHFFLQLVFLKNYKLFYNFIAENMPCHKNYQLFYSDFFALNSSHLENDCNKFCECHSCFVNFSPFNKIQNRLTFWII